jgi:hypothetical protein
VRCIRYIPLFLALAIMLTVACGGDERPTSITLGGRGLTMNVSDLQVIDGLVYQDTDNNFYNVGPAMEGHHFVAARVTIWNIRSGILSININEDAGILEGTEREKGLPVNPYERRVKLDERPAALSEHLPFLWGPSDLKQDFNITGWMVFEVPDGTEIAQLKWEQVDVLRFPITIS